MDSELDLLAENITENIGASSLSKKIKKLSLNELKELNTMIHKKIDTKIKSAVERIENSKKNDDVRLKTYTIDEVFTFLHHVKGDFLSDFYGDSTIKVGVEKARLFSKIGITCKKCDIHGEFFAVEQDINNGIHLNLYAYDEHGHECLLTIDHIKPKAKGGKNLIQNYQPLCKFCNIEKGDNF